MKLKGNTILFIAILVIMLAVIVSSLLMEYFESKLLPLMTSSAIFILAAMGLWRDIVKEYRPKEKVTEDDTGQREKDGEGWHGYLINASWIGGFALGVFFLGYFVTIPLFILFYMKRLGTSWRIATAFAVLTPLLLYFLFQLALQVEMYPGLLFKWLDRLFW